MAKISKIATKQFLDFINQYALCGIHRMHLHNGDRKPLCGIDLKWNFFVARLDWFFGEPICRNCTGSTHKSPEHIRILEIQEELIELAVYMMINKEIGSTL